MKIGEHEVEFVDSLPANPWWDLYASVQGGVSEASDEEGHFIIREAWDFDLQCEFLTAAIVAWDGEPVEDAGEIIEVTHWRATLLAAYNHVAELFLSGLPNSESVSD